MRILGSVIGALLVAVLAAGCTAEPPQPRSHGAAPPPVFGSRHEAELAARALYDRYLELQIQLYSRASADTSALAMVLEGELLTSQTTHFQEFIAGETRSVGVERTAYAGIVSYRPHSTQAADVMVFDVCTDISALDFVDAAGASVVSADRQDFIDFSYSMRLTSDDPGSLIMTDVSGRYASVCR